MPYIIKSTDYSKITKYLHEIENSETGSAYYTFYDTRNTDWGKYEFTREEVDEIYERYNWKNNKQVKTEFIPREVKVMKGQKRIINV